MRRSWPALGRSATGEKKTNVKFVNKVRQYFVVTCVLYYDQDRANGYNLSTSQGSYREWINMYFQYQNFKKYYLYAIEHSVFRESYNKQTYMLLQIFVNSVFLLSQNQILFSTAHSSPLGSPGRTNKMQDQLAE